MRGGGGGELVQKGLLNSFVANYFSQRRPRVSQPVNAGHHWRRKYCFASRSEQIIGYTNLSMKNCSSKQASDLMGWGWIRHWWWIIFNVRSCPRIVHADIRDIFIFIVNSRWEKIEEERNALNAMKQSLEKEGGKINRVLLV